MWKCLHGSRSRGWTNSHGLENCLESYKKRYEWKRENNLAGNQGDEAAVLINSVILHMSLNPSFVTFLPACSVTMGKKKSQVDHLQNRPLCKCPFSFYQSFFFPYSFTWQCFDGFDSKHIPHIFYGRSVSHRNKLALVYSNTIRIVY